MSIDRTSKKAVLAFSVFLTVICLCSIVYLMLPRKSDKTYIADIYQNGSLIMSIPLDGSLPDQTFIIEGPGGCVNEIQIRSGSIGILSADCPDKLCVRQGFIEDSRLPVTCLPNRLVIRLRPAPDHREGADEPDINVY